MSSDNMADSVKSFVTNNDIMSLAEYTKSNTYHASFCQDFTSGLINENEFKAQMKFQSYLLNECEQKIDQLTTENQTEDIGSDVLEILSLRIHKMYTLWFEILGMDAVMVADYIKFGSKNKLIITKFRKSLDQLMEYFQMDPDVYITIARCVFNDYNDIQSARKYLENGIKHHNRYKKLFEEEFCLEIEILTSNKGASYPMVLKKYHTIIDNFKDNLNFHFILVDHALNVLWVREFPCVVIRDMVNIYKQNELMWQKLAKIQLKGFIYNFNSEYVYQCKDDLNCISNCINTYEKGLKEDWLPTNQQNLWDFFLDNIIEIRKSDKMKNKVVENFVTEAIMRIFDQAHTNNKIHKADHFIFWAQHSPKDKELMILKESVNKMRNNPSLWIELLGYYLSKDYFQRGWSTFQKGINALQEESMPLWDMMHLYLLNTEDEMIQKFFEKASISKYKNISTEYRPKFLEWVFLRFGLVQSRKLFNELKVLRPICKELYTKMIHFECLSYIDDKYSLKLIRNLFSETCNTFGHNDIDLWTKCLNFEYMYGKKIFVEVIYLAALQMLEPQLRSAIVKVKDSLELKLKTHSTREISEIIEIID